MNGKKLYKDSKNGKIFGVCAGLAEYFEVDVTLIRLITVAVAFLSGGSGALAYIIAALIMPEKPTETPTTQQ